MSTMKKKVSEMIIDVSGDLFNAVDSLQEMQAHLDLVSTAWNMAIQPISHRNKTLKVFVDQQKKYAPNEEALSSLEW